MGEGRVRDRAAERKRIADTALRMFLERGYEQVGIREVADASDVPVTTVFAHFQTKEALYFDRDQSFEDRLVRAITDREPGASIPDALRREVRAIVAELVTPASRPFWRLVDDNETLRGYASNMWLRHERTLAAAIAADRGEPVPSVTSRAFARYVLGIYPMAQDAPDPPALVDEAFDLITPGWDAAVR